MDETGEKELEFLRLWPKFAEKAKQILEDSVPLEQTPPRHSTKLRKGTHSNDENQSNTDDPWRHAHTGILSDYYEDQGAYDQLRGDDHAPNSVLFSICFQ